jgi:hypothetical protein
MRELSRRDGAVILTGEGDDRDQVVVEAVVASFTPIRGNSFCACGAPLQQWGWRCVAADDVEFGCDRCHRVHGHFRLGTKVHR